MRHRLIESLALLCLATSAFAVDQPKLRFAVKLAARGGTFGPQIAMENGSAKCSGHAPQITCDVASSADRKRVGHITFSYLAPRAQQHASMTVDIRDSVLTTHTDCSPNIQCRVTKDTHDAETVFTWSVSQRGVAAQRREEPGWGCGGQTVRCFRMVWNESTKECTSKSCGFATIPEVKDEAAKKCRPTMTAEQACAQDARSQKCCNAANAKCPGQCTAQGLR